ncbi:MAG: TerC family protein [Anaerolineales bacterium]|jgi:predicted tellurium resistance membrane protein TerC
MDWITDPQSWIALVTLTVLEIVLGIDNIIFISILSDKLPENQQEAGRKIGLAAAMITRILLLFSIAWLTRLTNPLFFVFEHGISGRDIILLAGGLFLLAKSTYEIHDKLEGETGRTSAKVPPTFLGVIIQIMLLDIIFSLDSVITAVGMADELAIMIAAVVIAVGIMMYASSPISDFVNERPTLKILALSFLLLIGFALMADGLGLHIPKAYIYFAMGFSVFVEILNLRIASRSKEPVRLHQPYEKNGETG